MADGRMSMLAGLLLAAAAGAGASAGGWCRNRRTATRARRRRPVPERQLAVGPAATGRRRAVQRHSDVLRGRGPGLRGPRGSCPAGRASRPPRHFRLSSQRLTRRWRLNISAAPFRNSGLGVVLGQSFDDYADALSAIGRFSHWKIAQRNEIAVDAVHLVDFRFRLDMSQLPRLFQIDAVGRPGWDLLASYSQRLAPVPAQQQSAEPVR